MDDWRTITRMLRPPRRRIAHLGAGCFAAFLLCCAVLCCVVMCCAALRSSPTNPQSCSCVCSLSTAAAFRKLKINSCRIQRGPVDVSPYLRFDGIPTRIPRR